MSRLTFPISDPDPEYVEPDPMLTLEQSRGDEWRQGGFSRRHMEAIGVSRLVLTTEQADALAKLRAAIFAGGVVVLAGDRGGGKTFLATLAANEYCYDRSNQVASVRYSTLADWLSAARHTTIEGGEAEHVMVAKYARLGLLVIDEAQDRRGTEYADEMFTRLIDARYREMRPTVVIANVKPSELEREFGRSFMSRVQEGGGVIACNWPSIRKPENMRLVTESGLCRTEEAAV